MRALSGASLPVSALLAIGIVSSGCGKVSELQANRAVKQANQAYAAQDYEHAAELYRKGNREELAATEEAEILVIERFLPKQMSDDEASAAIQAIIAETGAAGMKDMGKVMGEVKSRLAGQIDPARASAMVRAALA